MVNAKTEVIALQCGRLVAEVKEPGWTCLSCWGRELTTVSTAQISISLPDMKVADHTGNPVIVSAVVQFNVVDAKKAVLDVQNYYEYVRLQAVTVLRQVVAQYPYESDDHSISLRSNTTNINAQLADTLNELTVTAGCRVISFRIDELAYSTEIAPIMLRKQAAQAMMSARKMIVDSAVTIACEAVQSMEQHGTRLTADEKSDLVVNMMTVICSGKDVVPTLPLSVSS